MKLRNVLILVSALIILNNCAGPPRVVLGESHLPSIPPALLEPIKITPLPEGPEIKISEALKLPALLRADACRLAFRVIELVKHASAGEIEIDRPKECEND